MNELILVFIMALITFVTRALPFVDRKSTRLNSSHS